MNVTEGSVERVQALVGDLVAPELVDPDEDLIDSGLLDSFALIELLTGIEEEFGIQLPLENLDLDVLRCIGSIASYVDGLRST